MRSATFAGLRFSSVLPLRGATHSPLMKFLYACEADAVAIRPPGQNRVYRRAPRGVKLGPTTASISSHSPFFKLSSNRNVTSQQCGHAPPQFILVYGMD